LKKEKKRIQVKKEVTVKEDGTHIRMFYAPFVLAEEEHSRKKSKQLGKGLLLKMIQQQKKELRIES